jgi:eukaryotic-like serine/threonine-protein kinase
MNEEGLEAYPAGIPRPGELLAGRYRVERLLGVGGMGAVLGTKESIPASAEGPATERTVALKVLLPAAMNNAEAVRRFLQEGRTCQRIRSEHIAKVYEVGTTDSGAPFLAMEYLEGLDLGAVVRSRGALTVSEAVDYVVQACEAIYEAHVLGIVHRDLKPANLFLTFDSGGNPKVKVLDFGISKVTRGEDLAVKTSTAFSFGTPVYMSPEQVRSTTNVDARTDVWALAVILFELLAGVPPFEAESLPALSLKIAMDPPTSLHGLAPSVPLDLEQAVLRCLEKDPARRLQNVLALVRAIAPFGPPSARVVLLDMERASEAVGSSTIALLGTDAPPLTPDTSVSWQTQTPPTPGGSVNVKHLAFFAVALTGLLGAVAVLLVLLRTPTHAATRTGDGPAASPGSSSVAVPVGAGSGAAAAITSDGTTPSPPASATVGAATSAAPTVEAPPKLAPPVRGRRKKLNLDERLPILSADRRAPARHAPGLFGLSAGGASREISRSKGRRRSPLPRRSEALLAAQVPRGLPQVRGEPTPRSFGGDTRESRDVPRERGEARHGVVGIQRRLGPRGRRRAR